jgi:hypothetical protein
MIFLEFITPDRLYYFAGRDWQSIKEDVTNPTRGFAWLDITRSRQVCRSEVEALGLRHFERGVQTVEHEGCASYMLGSVPVPRAAKPKSIVHPHP